ncbi:nucleotidyl transferase AbiEii/AbiGii toxin family protein [Prosthecobacter sp.]|uniref:nucleotidyl transferase AbiEii/AbiGii toxin family protein n=1 Tax=Prosthecobacter sp. TaxID=1965333 RepID=UPI002AB9DB3E|nr:nucleotidyl transferase AbiEii/AbiGii toxin family protein [Prosthecobacter sp.]MDZ4405357.1 nucleotidyl transferase AbiEii/AbiGii toxin family protein [Prosthecobacter sp.]
MLHREAVPPGTLDLLKRLCAHAGTEGFALVGGTSLALRFGHRMSVDLDFFRPEKFDNKIVSAALEADFPSFQLTNDNGNGMMAFVEDVKVDFVTYPYPLLHPFETIEGVRMMSLPDVVAMKLGAISNRGAKKDFYDLHTLLEELGLDEVMRCYKLKFPNHDPMIPLRSMIYFEDAEDTETPNTLINTTWAKVKADIQKAVSRAL